MKILIIYLFIINIISIAIMYTDKKSAENRLWRIEEKVIFFIAILGGSIGIYIGMRIFRHKTKKRKFKFGIPIIILINILLFTRLINILNFLYSNYNFNIM